MIALFKIHQLVKFYNDQALAEFIFSPVKFSTD